MGLFNFFNKSKSANTTPNAPAAPNPWDSLSQAPFAGDQPNTAPRQPESETARLARQGDKLITMYYHGPEAAAQPSVTVSDAERNKFYDALTSVNSDQITPAIESKLLQNIMLPSGPTGRENYAKVFTKIDTPHGLTILNYFTGNFGSHQASQPTPDTLASLLKSYPTPVEFAPRGEILINSLKERNIPGPEIDQFEDGLEAFQKAVYGKRYEYYQALNELRDQAYSRAKTHADAEASRSRLQTMQSLQHDPIPQETIDAELHDNPYAAPEARQQPSK